MSAITPEQQKKLDERDLCRKDKLYLAEQLGYDFVNEVHTELFAQFIIYDEHKPWAFQSDIKKRLILWPRGHYKTTAIVVEIIQIILNFPDIRILIMQGSIPTTQTLLHQIKTHFTGEAPKSRLRELFPEFCADQLGNVNSFIVPARKAKGLAQATVTVASPRKIKTGQHYDIGFFDDLVNESNYRSTKQLNKVKTDFTMCLPLIDPPHYAVLTGTRYAFGDLYEETIKMNKGEWTVSLKTCWLEDGKTVRFPQQKAKDGIRIIGYTREGLLSMADNDPEMFSSQFLNQPIQRGGNRFPKEFLETALITPDDAPGLSPAMLFVDLASSDAEKADDSVILCGKHDQLMIPYVVDGRGGQWVPAVTTQNLIDMVLIHRPVAIWIEKTPSGTIFAAYAQLAARQAGNIFLPIEFIDVSNKDDAKAIRIGALETYIKNKKLKFFVGLPIWAKMVEQFSKFSPGKKQHDDYPDTVALMVQKFGGAALVQPIRRVHPNAIIAMIQHAEQQQEDTARIMPTDPDDGSDGFFSF